MNPEYKNYLVEGINAAVKYNLSIPSNIQNGDIGDNIGKSVGSSLEYMDHREYYPGDDLRNVDWNAFARSDKLSVKLYRKEVSPHIDILMDCSRSINLIGSDKLRAVLGLSALFAQSAMNSSFSFSAWKLNESCQLVENGSLSPGLWKGLDFTSEKTPEFALHQRPPGLVSRGIRIFISDLLWLGKPLDLLSLLSDDAAAVFVIQILAEIDVNPPEWQNVNLIDIESGESQQMHVNSEAITKYKDRISRHQDNWNRTCIELGATMCTLVAENICGRHGLTEDWNLTELIRNQILEVT